MSKMKWQAVAAACLVSGMGYGAGFQLYTEGSAEALGQAGAISGRDDLTSLAWYNPSALAGAERPSLMIGSVFVQIKTDFDSAFGNDASMSDEWRIIPHFYYVQPIVDDLVATLSVNAPYGLITEWANSWDGAPLATYSELRAMYITPALSCRINDKLSVSAGFNVVEAEAELKSVLRTVEGDDLGYGYTASTRYEIAGDWAVSAR